MSNLPRPPAHLAAYVDALGVDGAVAFFLRFGGAELYIPLKPGARSPVADLLGSDAAARLSAEVDRLPRRVPTAKPWIAQVWRTQGLPVAEIARRLHASDVSVRRWLDEAPCGSRAAFDQRQGSLF